MPYKPIPIWAVDHFAKLVNIYDDDYYNTIAVEMTKLLPNSTRRLRRCLHRYGITTVERIVERTEKDLFQIDDFGKVCLDELKEILKKEYNLKLKEADPVTPKRAYSRNKILILALEYAISSGEFPKEQKSLMVSDLASLKTKE